VRKLFAYLALLILTFLIGGGLYNYIYRDELHFYKMLSMKSEKKENHIFLKDITNFDWDYVCAIHAYEIYSRLKLEGSLGFNYKGIIPESYGSSDGEVLLVFINKKTQTVIKELDASAIIRLDETRQICNEKDGIKLSLSKSLPYKKGGYWFRHKFSFE